MRRCSFVQFFVLVALLSGCAAPPAPQPTPAPTATPQTRPTVAAVAPSVTSAPRPTGAATVVPELPSPTPEPRDPIFDPRRISYAHNFALDEIQAYLDERGSVLATVRFQVGDRSMSFAHVLTGISSLYSINPALLLALLELHGGLVTNGQPSADALGFAMGYRADNGNRRGLNSQVRWAARELRYAVRDYDAAVRAIAPLPPLRFADGSSQEVSSEMAFSRYVLGRILAPTTSPGNLGPRMDQLVSTYTRLFHDPRDPPGDWPAPAEPFLTSPMDQPARITSFFDHNTPFLRVNGSIDTFWGRSETDVAFAYDGHTGWDYAMAPPERVIAAAPGKVIFAGNSDDGCATPARAVIIDHGNGYRSLYWHLYRISVEPGQQIERGAEVGIAGESGCAIGAHLHLQIQYLGRDVDPYGWCSPNPDPWATSPAGQISVWLWSDMPSPCGSPPPGTIVVDDGGPGFLSSGDWAPNEVGYGGGSRSAGGNFAGSSARPWLAALPVAPAVAIWQPELPAAGEYRVIAYIPYALNGFDESEEMRYLIRHEDGETLVTIDAEALRNWWADLGTYRFDPAHSPLVSLSTLAGDNRRGIWVDAVAFVALP
ncbi:MAG: peptidoglycan DD-metalloendopeptidase family protein [Oscillochloris sp.]|nr:peptidoglycan DD-metalloendopeptidase family protein [Oscillochloris sp.]